MNILLWVLQAALAFLSVSGGSYKISNFEKLQESMASMRALPQGLWMFFGTFEVVAGLALLWPKSAATAAAALLVELIAISSLYLYFGDRAPVPYTAFGAVLAAVIAYGRFSLRPF
jgi:uncharacterized membrane protein YphA (DoxX/SURF4 family)